MVSFKIEGTTESFDKAGDALDKYCGQDTEGMVRILAALRAA